MAGSRIKGKGSVPPVRLRRPPTLAGQPLALALTGSATPEPAAGSPAAGSAASPAYNAASSGRRLAGWRATGAGPNAVVAENGPELVRRSRDLGRNNPHARRALTLYRVHIVGTGAKPRSRCPDEVTRTAIHALWDRWVDQSDADGAYDFYGQQMMAVQELAEGGECFARLRPRSLRDGLVVPLQVQLLPAEQVPLHYGLPNGANTVLQGIERNQIGQRVAYWAYRQHPGEALLAQVPAADLLSRVDAADVCHLRLAPAGQLRGLPWLAAAMTTLKQLGDWQDAALLRKQLLTSLVGFVRRAIGAEMDEDKLAEAWGRMRQELGDLPAVELEPGTMQYLDPGEEVIFTNWQETSGADEAFQRNGLRAVAAAADLVYQELSGDWKDTNDRTFRANFGTFKREMQQYQFHLLGFQLVRPVYERFIDCAIACGALRVPAGISDGALKAFDLVPQRWEYLNPTQDVAAAVAEVEGGLTSREAQVAARGDDIEVVDAQRAADQARERRLGLAGAAPEPTARTP